MHPALRVHLLLARCSQEQIALVALLVQQLLLLLLLSLARPQWCQMVGVVIRCALRCHLDALALGGELESADWADERACGRRS